MLSVLLTLISLVAIYIVIILLIDPYGLFRGNTETKMIPYYTWHHYNSIKKFNKIDLALLGSSAVNYYSKNIFLPKYNQIFFMGIESSNIYEHLAYGRLLLEKKPKKIIFFFTFYSMNPSRRFQPEFNPLMLKYNNFLIDFWFQYLNLKAIKHFFKLIKNKFILKKNHLQLFHKDGRRTQLHYLTRKDYSFEQTLKNYLAAMSIDPHYYNSSAFKEPDSLISGFKAIKEFKDELIKKGIEIEFVATPVFRATIALKYHMGLGNTYERYRQEMLKLGDFLDLNLDLDFVSNPENFWDSHHVRNGEHISKLILNKSYLITSDNIEKSTAKLRPSQEELNYVKFLLKNNENWDFIKKKVFERS